MEQKFTVEEIVKDTKLRNTEKTKLLYLQHNKDYSEIAKLLNLKEVTVRSNVSSGGYCKQQKGKYSRGYGNIREELARIYDNNPDVTAVEIASEIGCGVSIIRRYARELGIKFKNSRGQQSKGISQKRTSHKKRNVCKPMPEKTELPKKEVTEKEIIEKTTEENMSPKDVETSDKLHNVSDKPYVVLEYPYVEYNNHICEILNRHKLRRYLYRDFKIIRHKRKPLTISKNDRY